MELDIMDIITSVGGAAGVAALAKVALDHHRGRKAARIDATKAASEASELLFQRHAQEFDRLGERLDTLETRNSAGPLKLDTLYGGACRLVREVFYVGEASES